MIHFTRLLIVLPAFTLLFQLPLFGQKPLVLKGGHVIDVKNGEVLEDQSVVIKGRTIHKVGNMENIDVPQNAKVIDSEGKYLLPGLMDAHIHFFQSGGLYTRPDIVDLRHVKPYKQEQQWVEERWDEMLRRYLHNGVTSVVDVGGPMKNFQIRDSIGREMVAPNIFLTGPLISTFQPKPFRIEEPPIIKANSPEEGRELVRKQLPHNPDFIKIWYIVTGDQTAKDNLPLVKAVIDESHKHDLKVAVHATELKTARLAVDAGADMLVHSVMNQVMDKAFLKTLKNKEVDYIPTLQVMNNYERTFNQAFDFSSRTFQTADPFAMGSLFDLKHLDSSGRPSWLNKTLKKPSKIKGKEDSIMAVNIRKVFNEGINVVTGTDAGNIGTLHGASYFREMALMKEAGLSNREVLQASTINGAKLLEASGKTGTIEKGKLADILVLNKNPLDSLKYVKNIHKVIKGGSVVPRDSLLLNSPKQLAQRQLNAYNAKDLEAFLDCYSDSVKIYNYPNKLQYQGIDKMEKVYTQFFNNAPNVHCELMNRIVKGNVVIDREKITGIPGKKPLHAVAIYKVANGKITEVTFIK